MLVLATLFVGCSDSSNSSDTDSAATTASTGTGTGTGTSVPDSLNFRAPLVGGGEFDGAAFAGRPTVFWFWAPT
jgi:hypothetical protein